MSERQITGRHVLAGMVAAFGVIIAVNVWMAYEAVHTFPGLETENSYVASQTFDARKRAQLALGWDVSAKVEASDFIVAFTGRDGRPVFPAKVEVMVGRTTDETDDMYPALQRRGDVFAAPVALARGLWTIRLTAQAGDGTLYQKRLAVEVW